MSSAEFEPFIEDGRPVDHVIEVRLSGEDLGILDHVAATRGVSTDAVIALALRAFADRRTLQPAKESFAALGERINDLANERQRRAINAEAPWRNAAALLAGV